MKTEDQGLYDLSGNHIEVNPDGTVTLYHRTSREKANEIYKTGKFFSLENRDETFFSNKPTGQAEGYGDAIISVNVPVEHLELEDAFENEIHVTVPNRHIPHSGSMLSVD